MWSFQCDLNKVILWKSGKLATRSFLELDESKKSERNILRIITFKLSVPRAWLEEEGGDPAVPATYRFVALFVSKQPTIGCENAMPVWWLPSVWHSKTPPLKILATSLKIGAMMGQVLSVYCNQDFFTVFEAILFGKQTQINGNVWGKCWIYWMSNNSRKLRVLKYLWIKS